MKKLPRPKRHRWFAATYDLLTRCVESRILGHIRKRLLVPTTGRVLEIGVGTGANLPYYPAGAQIIAADPDPFMLARARKRAEDLGLKVEFHQTSAEALPFPDASFDTVVSTLVLCSVEDQSRSLAEVRRVLRPGGDLRFIEHVRGAGFLGKVQDMVTPAWRWFGAGCHPNRRTREALESAGFEIAQLESQPLLLTPIIIGIAKRRELAH